MKPYAALVISIKRVVEKNNILIKSKMKPYAALVMFRFLVSVSGANIYCDESWANLDECEKNPDTGPAALDCIIAVGAPLVPRDCTKKRFDMNDSACVCPYLDANFACAIKYCTKSYNLTCFKLLISYSGPNGLCPDLAQDTDPNKPYYVGNGKNVPNAGYHSVWTSRMVFGLGLFLTPLALLF
jgi:hypothetical protein